MTFELVNLSCLHHAPLSKTNARPLIKHRKRRPLTEHHTEARFHRGNEVVESFHELVEKQEEHRHEGEEAEEEGHEETAQIIPALFQSGGENTCVTSRRENDYFLTSEIRGWGRKVNLKKGFIYSYLIY